MLLAGRVVQGIGGAALLTIGLASISASFQGPARGRALGLYFAAGATAAVIGPLVGGVLTSLVGWPGMFWVQVPLAVGTAAAAWAILPGRPAGAAARSTRRPSRWARSCCSGINGALLQADAWGWTSIGVLGGFAVAVLALGAFVWRERTTPEPAVRLEILRSRAFVVSTLVGAAAWFGILSGSVQLAVYLQEVRGLTPTETALVLLPWPLLAALIFPRGAAIVARFGAPRMMVLSLAFALAAAVLTLAFDPTTPLLVVSRRGGTGRRADVAGRRGQHDDRALGVRPRRSRDRRRRVQLACARSARRSASPSRRRPSTSRSRTARPTSCRVRTPRSSAGWSCSRCPCWRSCSCSAGRSRRRRRPPDRPRAPPPEPLDSAA